jgi:glucose/arabinose dehydrogenase
MLHHKLRLIGIAGLALGLIAGLGGCAGLPDITGPGAPAATATVPVSAPPAEASPTEPASLPPAATATPAAPTATVAPPSATAAPPTPLPAQGPPRLRVEEVATGLEVPWSLSFAPDGRLFFTERPGRVRVIVDGALQDAPVVEVPGVKRTSEGGLMGIALDPAFDQNHYLYVYHTYDDNGRTRNRLVRYVETGNAASDPQILFDGVLGAGNHDGGRIKFGPDGLLYITVGDAADADLAQDPAVLAGKILRLNPDGSVPGDNPFGTAIWSYGHRNPQGLAWQPDTNRLYETEHGPNGWDEMNFIEPGKNYGWPVVTGQQPGRAEFVDPLLTSGPAPAWAPSGAAFGTADWLAGWRGNFFFATLRGTHLHRVALDPADPRRVVEDEKLFEGEYGRLRDVVQGPDGLYFTTSNHDGRGSPAPTDDRILRLVPDDQQ